GHVCRWARTACCPYVRKGGQHDLARCLGCVGFEQEKIMRIGRRRDVRDLRRRNACDATERLVRSDPYLFRPAHALADVPLAFGKTDRVELVSGLLRRTARLDATDVE